MLVQKNKIITDSSYAGALENQNFNHANLAKLTKISLSHSNRSSASKEAENLNLVDAVINSTGSGKFGSNLRYRN